MSVRASLSRGSMALSLGAMLLAGCAENRVRLDAAQGVSRQARAAMRSVADYFAEVDARRRAAAAALVASDPSCAPSLRVGVQFPETVVRGKPAPLCPASATPAPGYQIVTVDFRPATEELLRPRLMLIDAVGAYAVALAKIVDDPGADIAGDLAEFGEKVDRAGKLLGVIAGADVPTVGGVLDSPEGRSLLALAQFAADLAREARQVRDVRALVAAKGETVDAALARLREVVEVRVSRDIFAAQQTRVEALERAYDAEKARLAFPERHRLVTTLFDARAELAGLGDTRDKVLAAIDQTQGAQRGLRNALDGRFSPEQRRQIAALNLDRLTRAFELIADLGKAFI